MLNLLLTSEFNIDKESKKEKYIKFLENSIISYQESLLYGEVLVDDVEYNNCLELLGLLNPNSPLLKNANNVMLIKDFTEDVVSFLEEETKDMNLLEFYANPQGLNVRLTYNQGKLVSAETFGRSLNNYDILDIIKLILTDRNDNMTDLGKVIIEGALVLPEDNILMLADMGIEEIKVSNSYETLFSLLNYYMDNKDNLEKLSDIGNLEDFIYFMATDIKIEDFILPSIEYRYSELERLGFERPDFYQIEKQDNIIYNIEYALLEIDSNHSNLNYLSDGIRLLLNSDKIVLFKRGSWEIEIYNENVKDIDWIISEEEYKPVVVLEKSVNVGNRGYIDRVELQNIALLLILNIEKGKPFYFSSFGDVGLLPIYNNEKIVI